MGLWLKEIRLLLITSYHSGFFLTTVFIFCFTLVFLTFPSIWILNFLSPVGLSVPVGVRSVVCQGWCCSASVQLPWLAPFWPLAIGSNTSANTSPCLTVVLPLFLVSVVIDEVCMVLLFQPPDTTPDLLVPSTPPMCMGPQVKDEYIFTVICAFISDFCPFQFPLNNIHVLKMICFFNLKLIC